MEEREKGWDLTSKLIFSASGLVNEREFLTQNISEYSEYMRNICLIPFIAFYFAATKKYFEKAVTDYDPDDDSKVDSDSTEWW